MNWANESHSANQVNWVSKWTLALSVGVCVQPTLVVTVRRGFPSEEALRGNSFSIMATTLESFPYNSEINSEPRQCAAKISMGSYRYVLIIDYII